jgi:hypothetical protein
MNKKIILSAGAALAALVSTPALAVTNFSSDFDSLSVPVGSYSIVNSIDGWTAGSGAGIEVQNHAAGTPYSNPNLVELDSDNNSSMFRFIDAGIYTLTFQYSARPGVAAGSNIIDLFLGNSATPYLSVTANGTNVTNWVQQTVNFTVFETTKLAFGAGGVSDSFGGYIDSINLSGTAVPEPATWAMMILGMGAAGAMMRRRRQTAVSFA